MRTSFVDEFAGWPMMHQFTRTTVRVVAAAGVVLMAAGCGGGRAANSAVNSAAPSPTPSSLATSATPTSPPAPQRVLTPQGFLAKDVGQLAGLDCVSDLDSCAIKFTLDKIEVNPQCYPYGTAAEPGRKTLLLHVSMTTGKLSDDGSRVAPMIFNPFSLKGIGDDGFVHDAQPGSCTDYEGRLSSTVLPNSRYAGTVEVVVPESTTSIAASQQADADGGRGWVWKIG